MKITKFWLPYFLSGITIIFFMSFIGVLILKTPNDTPFLKGQKLASKFGCFACHGSGGLEGIPNPGSEDGDIPSWNGGMAMMYLENDRHIEEYILHGHRKDYDHSHEKGIISMPAFEKLLNQSDLQALVTYVKAVSEFYPDMPIKAKQGFTIAKRNGCFGCHGPSGRGGISNPGSFKGTIPGWDGRDFKETVKDEKELLEWIQNGTILRFTKNPIANFFIKRQAIKMPGYKNVLNENDIKSIINYIYWVRGNSP